MRTHKREHAHTQTHPPTHTHKNKHKHICALCFPQQCEMQGFDCFSNGGQGFLEMEISAPSGYFLPDFLTSTTSASDNDVNVSSSPITQGVQAKRRGEDVIVLDNTLFKRESPASFVAARLRMAEKHDHCFPGRCPALKQTGVLLVAGTKQCM